MKKLVTLLSLTALAFSGCETIVDVDTPPHTPRLALNYTLSNQLPNAYNQEFFANRALFVSTSQSVLEVKELTGRGNATVEVLDESGQVVERFRSKPKRTYNNYGQVDSLYGDYVPTRGLVGEPGHTYTLRASAPGLETVESTLTLPFPTVIETGSYSEQQVTQNGSTFKIGRLTCSILDNAATTDYYMAYARVLDRNGNFCGTVQRDNNRNNGGGPDVNLGLFQLSNTNSNYDQYPFSDVGGNGQRLTLSTDVSFFVRSYPVDPTNPRSPYITPEPGYIEIVVSSITADTYRFYQSRNRYNDTDGNPFAEPAPLFSNVRPGYGIFGGATDVTYRIPL
ncbi:DUF4249 domain-containing protein [Hymenobacter sp. YC55]|uniref:DUF4249 domain-containing protein n=1 Tax=Hymenobacter sp. YC55 TaxID=3034019 RepID=UPI0023F61FD0|nr:DUF4249 domain-containing protein [Hymenobacter sp. YC55]MDF7809993.1 DUF4249 domain-containing protein [Hymenobacter sp. YC55]